MDYCVTTIASSGKQELVKVESIVQYKQLQMETSDSRQPSIQDFAVRMTIYYAATLVEDRIVLENYIRSAFDKEKISAFASNLSQQMLVSIEQYGVQSRTESPSIS